MEEDEPIPSEEAPGASSFRSVMSRALPSA
jgi:hypothetical protein